MVAEGQNLATPVSLALQHRFQQPYQANIHNKASLQRGAQLYSNYCLTCHSLHHETYQNLLTYLGITDPQQQQTIANQLLLFDPKADISHSIDSALSETQGRQWFGVAPPDLTTIAVQKDPTWLYQFLRSFYMDASRPHGCNNVVSPNTAMPNVLEPLRGQVQAVVDQHHITRLVTIKAGRLSPLEFDHRMADLVNFLVFIAEPWHDTRLGIGIAFCLLIFLLALVCHWLFKKRD